MNVVTDRYQPSTQRHYRSRISFGAVRNDGEAHVYEGLTPRMSRVAKWRFPCLCKGSDTLTRRLHPVVMRNLRASQKRLRLLLISFSPRRATPVPAALCSRS